MVSNNLIFSKAAALRILPFALKIEAIRVFKGSIQVTYLTKDGRCSTFLSKKAFYNDFLTFRQRGARGCTVIPFGAGCYSGHYEVRSLKGENIYTVKRIARIPRCSCPDYHQQERELGKASVGCKHVIAVVNYLGYNSLTQYIEAVSQKAKADLFGGGWDEQPQHLIEPHADFIDDVNQEVASSPAHSNTDGQLKEP